MCDKSFQVSAVANGISWIFYKWYDTWSNNVWQLLKIGKYAITNVIVSFHFRYSLMFQQNILSEYKILCQIINHQRIVGLNAWPIFDGMTLKNFPWIYEWKLFSFKSLTGLTQTQMTSTFHHESKKSNWNNRALFCQKLLLVTLCLILPFPKLLQLYCSNKISYNMFY